MALLEEVMKNTATLSAEEKEELRKSFRRTCTKKSRRLVRFTCAA